MMAAVLAVSSLMLQADPVTVKMLPGEHWWGVMNYYGSQMPFDEKTDLVMDVRRDNKSNQAASFLVSDKGRSLWCDEQTLVTLKNGTITMASEAAPVLLDASGKVPRRRTSPHRSGACRTLCARVDKGGRIL